MKHRDNVAANGDIRIYQAVRYLNRDEIERIVRANAARIDFPVDDRHLAVVRSLIEHYRHDGLRPLNAPRAVEERMRFLEEAYEFLGGAGYLHRLFGVAGVPALLARLHWLAGLAADDDADIGDDDGFDAPRLAPAMGPPVPRYAG